MNSFFDSAATALSLLLSFDPVLLAIVGRSLAVSALACLLGCGVAHADELAEVQRLQGAGQAAEALQRAWDDAHPDVDALHLEPLSASGGSGPGCEDDACDVAVLGHSRLLVR